MFERSRCIDVRKPPRVGLRIRSRKRGWCGLTGIGGRDTFLSGMRRLSRWKGNCCGLCFREAGEPRGRGIVKVPLASLAGRAKAPVPTQASKTA